MLSILVWDHCYKFETLLVIYDMCILKILYFIVNAISSVLYVFLLKYYLLGKLLLAIY